MKRFFVHAGAGLAAAAMMVAFSGTGCQPTGVGDPCTPEAEYSTSFLGFSDQEVSTESADYQCFSRLCLVNHFRGRVSCPYGQDAMRNKDWNVSGAQATAPQGCVTPYITQAVDGINSQGQPVNPNGPIVQPQCISRRADQAVYCSCRCANAAGQTNDGAVYCQCPDGFSCTQLVASIGGNLDKGLTGAYCIKSGTDYDPNAPCAGDCSANSNNSGNCGTAQGVTGM
jgi:hypothetical protein